jgi:hypothetical protein
MNHEDFKQIMKEMSKDQRFYIKTVDLMNGDVDTIIFEYSLSLLKLERDGEFSSLYKANTCAFCNHTKWNNISLGIYFRSLDGIISCIIDAEAKEQSSELLEEKRE